MYIAYISLFRFVKKEEIFFKFVLAPLLMIDKRGENDFELYACSEIEFMHVLFFMFIQKERKEFGVSYMHVSI